MGFFSWLFGKPVSPPVVRQPVVRPEELFSEKITVELVISGPPPPVPYRPGPYDFPHQVYDSSESIPFNTWFRRDTSSNGNFLY